MTTYVAKPGKPLKDLTVFVTDTLIVEAKAKAIGITLVGGREDNAGTSITTINEGGVENVLEGGTAERLTTINHGGVLNVLSGGKSDHVTIHDGGIENAYGNAGNTDIWNGGVLNVLFG